MQADWDRMANSVDPDQTGPSGAVWSGSILFAQTYLYINVFLHQLCFFRITQFLYMADSFLTVPLSGTGCNKIYSHVNREHSVKFVHLHSLISHYYPHEIVLGHWPQIVPSDSVGHRMKCPCGRAVSALDFRSGGRGFRTWTALHCTEPFMFTLPSSQYDWNTVERDVQNPNSSIHLSEQRWRPFCCAQAHILLVKEMLSFTRDGYGQTIHVLMDDANHFSFMFWSWSVFLSFFFSFCSISL